MPSHVANYEASNNPMIVYWLTCNHLTVELLPLLLLDMYVFMYHEIYIPLNNVHIFQMACSLQHSNVHEAFPPVDFLYIFALDVHSQMLYYSISTCLKKKKERERRHAEAFQGPKPSLTVVFM